MFTGAADVLEHLTECEEPPAAVDELPCRVHDPDLWFADRPDELEQAKALCRCCPIRAVCLSGAVARREPWGVWGGEIVLQGVVVPRKRPRGRPRRHRETATDAA